MIKFNRKEAKMAKQAAAKQQAATQQKTTTNRKVRGALQWAIFFFQAFHVIIKLLNLLSDVRL